MQESKILTSNNSVVSISVLLAPLPFGNARDAFNQAMHEYKKGQKVAQPPIKQAKPE